MSTYEEEIRYLPYEEAFKIVGAIQEEEDIERPNHRILTVYDHKGSRTWGNPLSG